MSKNFAVVVIIIFVVLSGIFYALKLSKPEYNFVELMVGNAIMALLSAGTYYFLKNQMSGRPAAFVRGVSAATFTKLIVCMAAIMAYAFLNKDHLHKPSLFVLFGIYAVYTVAETRFLSKLAKETK